MPSPSTAMPEGSPNAAAVPTPSENTPEPLPASVLTAPPGATTRSRLLSRSATYALPLASTATP
jgi:hypothetical protein